MHLICQIRFLKIKGKESSIKNMDYESFNRLTSSEVNYINQKCKALMSYFNIPINEKC